MFFVNRVLVSLIIVLAVLLPVLAIAATDAEINAELGVILAPMTVPEPTWAEELIAWLSSWTEIKITFEKLADYVSVFFGLFL